MNLGKTSLYALNLPDSITHLLFKGKVLSMEQLETLTKADLLAIPNIGRKTATIIENALIKSGRSLS